MKKAEYSTLGMSLQFAVAESVDEYNTLAKRPQGCLEDSNDNTVYRNSLTKFRDAFCKKVEADSGIPRHTKTVELKSKNPDGTLKTSVVWDESEADYFKRVLATRNEEPEAWATVAQAIADTIAFDPSEKPSQPKTPPKEALALANDALAKGKLEKVATKLSKSLGRQVPADVTAVAWAIRDDMNRIAEERKAALRAMVAD